MPARYEMYRQALVSSSPNVHPFDDSFEYSDSRRLLQNNNCGNPASELSQHGDKRTVDDGEHAIEKQNSSTVLREGQGTADRPES